MAINKETEQFQNASARIQELYREGLLTHLSGRKVHSNDIEIPPVSWRWLGQEFPTFSNKIFLLGKVVSEAEFERDHTPLPQTELFRTMFFTFAGGDKEGQYLMSDILRFRVNEATQHIQIISTPQEAHAMLQEYGFKDGVLTHTSFSPINLSAVVARVLEGKLKLNPQTYKKPR
jgi:hypothetical protein